MLTPASPEPLRVTVWSEARHERSERDVAQRYPAGIHGAIAAGIADLLTVDAEITTVTLDEPEAGLAPARLDATDVLVWWGHIAHDEVPEHVVEAVQMRVLSGMGLVVLHSGHFSRIFRRLMGTSCALRWRAERDRELLWTVSPSHPIAAGVPSPMILDEHEMYGEHFDIPPPDELIFISSFSGGEVFRSGCTFTRGRGRIFYFSPGDQAYPVYHHPHVRRVIANAVGWAAPCEPSSEPRLRQSPLNWFAPP